MFTTLGSCYSHNAAFLEVNISFQKRGRCCYGFEAYFGAADFCSVIPLLYRGRNLQLEKLENFTILRNVLNC